MQHDNSNMHVMYATHGRQQPMGYRITLTCEQAENRRTAGTSVRNSIWLEKTPRTTVSGDMREGGKTEVDEIQAKTKEREIVKDKDRDKDKDNKVENQ